MDPVQSLINSVFGSALWNSTSLLDKLGDNNSLGTMVAIGYAFAALMLIFQLVITVLNISKSENVWENIGPLIYRTVLIAALISVPLYSLLFRYTLAGTTNTIANAIFTDYAKDFLTSWQNIFKSSATGPSTPWGVIMASLDGSLVSNILSSIIFLAAVVCVFIVAMLQPFLWLFCFYVGPICLAFGICDLTTHVARNWLNMFLVVNFVGIFGSISFSVAQTAGLLTSFQTGCAASNIILVAVYGIMSIIFFCAIWPITGYIFSGQSPIGNGGSVKAGVGVAAAGTMAYGAGMAGMGSALSKVAPAGSRLGQVASGMQSHGKGMMSASENVTRLAGGRAPKAQAASGSQQGSQQTQPSIPNVASGGSTTGQSAGGGPGSGASASGGSEQRNSSIPG